MKRVAALVAAVMLTGCGTSHHTSAFCSGSGSPTVGLIPGRGAKHEEWSSVQRLTALFTRTCSYDAINGVDPEGPLVLVGHSLGGLRVRIYAAEHPRQVAGVVLVDSLHPRLESFSAPPAPDVAAVLAKARRAPNLGAKPLVVIQAGREISDAVPPRLRVRLNRQWTRLQADLARLSSDHIHVIAATSTHDVPRDQPDVVATAVRAVMDAVWNHRALEPCANVFARVAAQCVSGPSR